MDCLACGREVGHGLAMTEDDQSICNINEFQSPTHDGEFMNGKIIIQATFKGKPAIVCPVCCTKIMAEAVSDMIKMREYWEWTPQIFLRVFLAHSNMSVSLKKIAEENAEKLARKEVADASFRNRNQGTADGQAHAR